MFAFDNLQVKLHCNLAAYSFLCLGIVVLRDITGVVAVGGLNIIYYSSSGSGSACLTVFLGMTRLARKTHAPAFPRPDYVHISPLRAR